MHILLLLSLLSFCPGFATAAIQVPDSRDYLLNIGKEVFHYADSKGTFTPDDFRKDLFTAGNKTFLGDGRHDWLYLQLVNSHPTPKETRLWLQDGYYYDHIEVHLAQNGSAFSPWATLSGFKPFEERLHRSKNLVIPLEIPANSEISVLIKIESRNSISFTPILASPTKYEEVSRRDYVIYGLLFGAVFINFVYNFLLYYRMREASLLYYSGYLAGLCILFLSMSGFGNEFIWGGGSQFLAVNLGSALVGCMLTQFSRMFLKIPEFSCTLDRLMKLTSMGLGALVVLSLFGLPPVFTNLIYAGDLLGILASIAAIVVALRKHYQPARMFALAWGAFFGGALMILFTSLGFAETNVLSQYGMQIGAVVQMAFLALASADQMAEKSRQIAALTEKRTAELEAEVASRTRAMREIVDNVASGFFLIGRDQRIQEGFTASCLNIMGQGFSASQLLSECLDLSTDRKAHFSMAIEQVFEDFMPSSVSLSLLPSRLKMGEKVVSFEASVIRDDANAVAKILFTVTDATALVAAEAQKKIDNALIGILRQRNAFTRFVQDFDSSLLKTKEFLKIGAQREVRQILHTLKGNASIFSLDDVVQIIHDVESSDTITATQVDTIDRAMNEFFLQHLTDLGFQRETMGEEICQIKRDRVKQFRAQSLHAKQLEELRALSLQLSDELCLRPAREFLSPLETMAKKVADKLSKSVEIVVEGRDVPIDYDRADPIIRNLPHLVRNSLSHGLEDAEHRQDQGKPPKGVLNISISETRDSIIFEVSDDGRGIHPEMVASAALKKGHVTQDELARMSDVDKQWLIFRASFSTASEVTEISGRGVGMDAVLEAVKESEASLTMDSRVGQGTRFTITLPRRLSGNKASAHLQSAS
jgi:signal transduction histidine kinase